MAKRPSWALVVLLVGAAWGATYALYPVGNALAGPYWLAALRFDAFLGGAAVAALALDRRIARPATRADWAAVATYAALNIVLHNLGTIVGAGHVPVALLGILAGSTPLLTAALMPLVLGTRVTWRVAAALAVAFAGVALLAVARGPGGEAPSLPWVLLVAAAFLAWSVGSVAIRRTGTRMPALSIGVWAALPAALVLHGTALAMAGPAPEPSWALVGVVAFVGLVGGVGGFAGWLWLVRTHGPAHASLPSFVSPAVASAGGALWLGQGLGWTHAASYALVLAGLALAWRFLAQGPAEKPQPDATMASAD